MDEPIGSAMVYSVVFFACVLPVYDLIGSPLVILMMAMGLIWRYDRKRRAVLLGRGAKEPVS
jgi:hypothetical protein